MRPGGVVVEAAFASAFGIHVGDSLRLGGTAFRVVGTAVTAAIPAYPGTCGRPIGCFLVGNIGPTTPASSGRPKRTRSNLRELRTRGLPLEP